MQIRWAERCRVSEALIGKIKGESMAQDQGMAIRDLTAGLAAQGFLPAEFREGQVQLFLLEWRLEQPEPFIQQLFARFFGAITGA